MQTTEDLAFRQCFWKATGKPYIRQLDPEPMQYKAPQKQWLSDKDYLEIFPTARQYLKERLYSLKMEAQRLQRNLDRETKRGQDLKGDDRVFFEQQLDVKYRYHLGKKIPKAPDGFPDVKIKNITSEIKKISWLLYPPKVKRGETTDEMKERANQHPIENILPNPVRNGMTICPFHNNGQEKKPSMNVRNNWYYCHSCQAHGDVIKLAMELNGWTFPQAVKYLC